ncbi:penicillin-binding protein 2 [Foetidibacter luteolus]|uniref:penicillin-binding protein 2 n=1 Tax=Foetidibacter luteolus TaxID=2608880 RepID=UPI00129A7123|nr:penicillin-binding protein 2 [Foetidibacter luteolus]
MPVYNQSRSRVIQIIFIAIFLIIVAQLLNLQLFSSKYKLQAESNAIYRKVVYPDRGIIYDRKRKAVLENTIMYDLVITPSEIRQTDTFALCNILGIDTAEFKKRVLTSIIKNSRYKPSVFVPLLTPELYARLNENMYKFPGFVLQERPVRAYPFGAAGNVLGYLGEVDTGFLRKHVEEGYEMGDYAGMTGLERSYERVLMGQRGVKQFIRDNRGRLQGSFENGMYDTTAIAGKSLYLSLDVELQQLGEQLMTNKVGSIVAIDPKTGGILCMVSAPTYNPNYLTGPERRKHFSELFTDPRLPLLNRTMGTYYSPGSTFKTVVGIIGMAEGVIDDKMTVSCPGAYYGCGRMGCHAAGTFNLRGAISKSCNSYFAVAFRRELDQPGMPSRDSALSSFNQYAYSFGLGNRLGVDLPSEKRGNIPTGKYYQKIFGKKWQSCNIISNSIGQGEILTTLTQLSNVMAIIANKGWYYTPHLVDSIEDGDTFKMLEPYRQKHYTKDIDPAIFEAVHDGMQGTMEFGTGAAAKVPGVVVCGKTGTVENSAKVDGKMEKQKDHAFFGAFAPRDNPRIAIAVMCENAGFGSTSAAPIASLLIEKYLKDSITDPRRKAEVDRLTKMNLIPNRMRREMVKLDSIRRVKDSMRIIKERAAKEARDTVDIEEQPEFDSKSGNNAPRTQPGQTTNPPSTGGAPANDSSSRKPATLKTPAAIINGDDKKNNRNYKKV